MGLFLELEVGWKMGGRGRCCVWSKYGLISDWPKVKDDDFGLVEVDWADCGGEEVGWHGCGKEGVA